LTALGKALVRGIAQHFVAQGMARMSGATSEALEATKTRPFVWRNGLLKTERPGYYVTRHLPWCSAIHFAIWHTSASFVFPLQNLALPNDASE
jgi:hypothetical protein